MTAVVAVLVWAGDRTTPAGNDGSAASGAGAVALLAVRRAGPVGGRTRSALGGRVGGCGTDRRACGSAREHFWCTAVGVLPSRRWCCASGWPLPRLLGWAALEIVLAGVAFVVTAPLTRLLQTRVFGWWPQAWTIRLGLDAQYGDQALMITAVLLLIGSVLAAPIVEELYFRGFLLPRMPGRLGRWRIPAHVRCSLPTTCGRLGSSRREALAILPLAYVAVRTRDVRVGIVAHACSTPPTWSCCLRTSSRADVRGPSTGCAVPSHTGIFAVRPSSTNL